MPAMKNNTQKQKLNGTAMRLRAKAKRAKAAALEVDAKKPATLKRTGRATAKASPVR